MKAGMNNSSTKQSIYKPENRCSCGKYCNLVIEFATMYNVYDIKHVKVSPMSVKTHGQKKNKKLEF